ncbi:MAG TPA: secretin N-terminal domain-containing protein [Longimicrobiales bacterium]|nr:secretin N-terminal domain-containing protein [Longimicrobiales bacterium]
MRGGILALALVGSNLPPAAVVAAQEGEAADSVTVTADGVVLDFQNADLRLVISALAEAGGLNLVFGDLPARPVTLRMSRPVPAAGILPLLRSVAAANDLTLHEDAGLIRVEAAAPQPRRGPAPNRQQEAAAERKLHVYRLRHAQAPVLAQTLGQLFGGRGPAAATPGRPPQDPGRTQRIPPVRLEAEPEIRVDVGAVRQPALAGDVTGEVQIVPDELTNSLLIRAADADFEVIAQAIQALDLRPLQALIEVLIVEVRRDRNHEVGVSLGQIDSLSPPLTDRVQGRLLGSAGGDFTLTVRDLGTLGIDAAVSILAASGNVRILSRPVVVAQNNQEARILVGTERPFVQVFRSLPTESAIRDQIVQYRDVGTELTIVPTINPDGYVNLDVLQEVSSATSETQFGAPVISTRVASTRLFVKDGQSVVIGGLIDEQVDRARSGIPLLKDIPLLGYFFGTTRDRRIQSEMFLFLTPHIVETDDDIDRMNEEIGERTRLLRDLPPPLISPPPAEVDTTSSGVGSGGGGPG